MMKKVRPNIFSYITQDKPWPRDFVLSILKTAIEVGENRFAREVALSWLIAYPGDLTVILFHAQTLIKEKQFEQALSLLEMLCVKDPEYFEAQEQLFNLQSNVGSNEVAVTHGCVYALDEKPAPNGTVPKWCRFLRQARHALSESISKQSLENAEIILGKSLAYDPPTPLMAVTHLRILSLNSSTPLATMRTLAIHYQQQWPDCLTIQLILADILMRTGKSEKAVEIIHRVASQDVSGQIATRLWGSEHKYKALWPDKLVLYIKLPIPAEVAGALGLNLLPHGIQKSEDPLWDYQEEEKFQRSSLFERTDSWKKESQDETVGKFSSRYKGSAGESEEHSPKSPISPQPSSDLANGHDSPEKHQSIPESLKSVQSELERVARRLKRPGLVRSDGRFPIYVVFTTRRGLNKKFGQENTGKIHDAIRNLVVSVRSRRDWGSIHLYADDPTSTAAFGINPGLAKDPWELKLVLADLDEALGKQGAMIGAVLIVGGPQVVPFHNLPNPTDDVDDYVPSDNPYSTRDENYFIPEWSVGRLTCGNRSDPELLVNMINAISTNQESQGMQTKNWFKLWWKTIFSLLRPSRWHMRQSFGYSAEAWRRAAWNVFSSIGEARDLITSPPEGVQNGTFLPLTHLGYFNLHGLVNVGDWYGQRDLLASPDGEDYPVALRPQDIQNNGQAPQIVFTEACYGANILDREVEQAMALKFLASGSQVVIGSTVMSYGSVNPPLIAADLLGKSFWEFMREGYSAGEAFRRAKIHLAQEMHHRQGYLDGEDQKTLISYIYLGDPLADMETHGLDFSKLRKVIPLAKSKSAGMLRSPLPTTQISTICDKSETPGCSDPVPPEVMIHVKQVVAQYLPGLSGAQLSLHNEHAVCHGKGHACPTAQLMGNSHTNGQKLRRIVVLSKQLKTDNQVHHHYARLRLDKDGKVVKLAVSR